jgi:hypothetical protein
MGILSFYRSAFSIGAASTTVSCADSWQHGSTIAFGCFIVARFENETLDFASIR